MKKYLAVIVLTGIAAGMISGCTGAAQETAAEAEPPVVEEAVEETEEAVEETAETEEAAEPEKTEETGTASEYTAEEMDKILEDKDLFDGKSAKELGYNWLCLGEAGRIREEDDVFDINGVNELLDKEDYVWLIDSVKKADWDNDGIYEYCRPGDMDFSGLYFDMTGDVLTAVWGYGPYSMGWNELAYIDGKYWVYDASGNFGKTYRFDRYDEKHELADTILYEVSYDQDDEELKNPSYSMGKDYDSMSGISEEEFNEMCGDNGLINEPLPELENNGDQELTDKLYEAIKEFFEGKRPALVRYEG